MASNRKQRQQDIHFKIMRLLQDDPTVSTRQIADYVGISNGAAYYCVHAFIDRGYVKLKNFSRSDTKSIFFYELTPRGIKKKAALMVQFLDRKRDEYNALQSEIERLEQEIGIIDGKNDEEKLEST